MPIHGRAESLNLATAADRVSLHFRHRAAHVVGRQWIESGAWRWTRTPQGARGALGWDVDVHDLHPDGLVVADADASIVYVNARGRARSLGHVAPTSCSAPTSATSLPLQDNDGPVAGGPAPTPGAAWRSGPATASGC